jgi:uncharacterized protein YdhG (YjbR/CyaY superfamily)
VKILDPKKAPINIDDYIAAQPAEISPLLQKIRLAIHEAAPNAEETISYQMPAFKQNGALVYFAAFKDHLSFFPTGSGVEAFKDRLKMYKTSKGTIQLPLDQPLPLDLIKEIVRFRVKETSAKR